MLKEIRCDKFVSKGSIRKPIIFHKGLNTVLGSDSGTNSIGKSTFLMIVDFVFGGNDYIEKATDVHSNVGPHTIQFCFEFDNQPFFFSRETTAKNEVNVCDNDYNVKETISLDKYFKFLHDRYSIPSEEQTFRGAVSTFFRVYLRECCDEGRPLKNGDRAADKTGIIELIKLFDKYSVISEYLKKQDDAEKREKSYKNAISYNQIVAPRNKTEYKNNALRIADLRKELEELKEKNDAGLLDVDSVIARQISEIKGILSKLRRQRTRLKKQLEDLSEENQAKKISERDFKELARFFPNTDTKTLSEIESFHSSLYDALAFEVKQQKESLENLLLITEEEISRQESELRRISSGSNVSKAVLDLYANLMQEYNNLNDANKHYDEKEKLHDVVKELSELISKTFKSELSTLALDLNRQMAEYNGYVYHEDRTAPYIEIKDESHYSFDTPNDRGTGSRYKGLILFDLSVMSLTALPTIAHDSFMLKQIEDNVLEKLFELYSKTPKQVFIAMDKETSYTPRARELLDGSVVLHLSSDGNELFGRSWNIKPKEDKHQ